MPSLKIEITTNLTEVVDLVGPITLGRGKDNDIILLENVVSRQHSRVYFDNDDVIIEDLNSSNGIYVNGSRVFLRALQDKDVIRIGKTKIYYSTEHLDKPTREIDLTTKPLSNYDVQEIIALPDVSFRFRSDDESINQIYEITRQKFESLPVSDMERINLDAALNEGIGNAQRHGHKYNADLIIEFRYIHKPDRLILRITDQGEGFDYRAELQKKQSSSAVQEARDRYKAGGYGGLGIMLMLRCVHSVEYNRKGNQVTLTKYLGDAAQKFAEDQKRIAEQDQKATESQEAKSQQDRQQAQKQAQKQQQSKAPKPSAPARPQAQQQEDAGGIEISPDDDGGDAGDRFLIEPD